MTPVTVCGGLSDLWLKAPAVELVVITGRVSSRVEACTAYRLSTWTWVLWLWLAL
jgi:hypothetical protein